MRSNNISTFPSRIFLGLAWSVFVIGLPSISLGQGTPPSEQTTSEKGNSTEDSGLKPPKSLKEKASFIAGYQFLRNAKAQGIEFDLSQLIAGLKTAEQGNELGISIEEINAVNMAFQREIVKKREAKFEELAAKNDAEGRAFVVKYAQGSGVKKTPGGLYYKVLSPGTGPKPTRADQVKIHFKGTSIDGETLIKTNGREPATLSVAAQIPGFVEVIQLMKTGAKWEVVIPPEQGFGKKGSRTSGPNQTVIYEIDLVEVVSASETETHSKEGDGK